MSTRGTTYYSEVTPMDWSPDPKPWCADHCSRTCDCPTGDTLTIPANIELGAE